MKFKNGCEAFNFLSHMPVQPIDLGCGRILHIREWIPKGDKECRETHHVPVTIEGFITFESKEENHEVQ